MPSLSFHKCPCGTEYKVMLEHAANAQTYECACGEPVVFYGEVVALWLTTKPEGTIVDEPEWTKVPIADLRDWG
jgi:hypothetical protein